MAKFASIITLLFIALVLFTAFEAPMMVGAMDFGNNPDEDPTQNCRGHECRTTKPGGGAHKYQPGPQKGCRRQSGTLRGVCKDNNACRNQCARLEKAVHGSCNNEKICTCYFSC